MARKQAVTVNIGYIRQKIGKDNLVSVAYKMGLSDNTARRLLYKAEATPETIARFCNTYNAEYEKVVAKPCGTSKPDQNKEGSETETCVGAADGFAMMSKKVDALIEAITALTETASTLAEVRSELAECKAQLVSIHNLAKDSAENQLNFMEHSRRCHNGIYSFLKKLNEPTA